MLTGSGFSLVFNHVISSREKRKQNIFLTFWS